VEQPIRNGNTNRKTKEKRNQSSAANLLLKKHLLACRAVQTREKMADDCHQIDSAEVDCD
jgi:hypothetical protein